jgi:putative PIN family toxin of toxin-antitoxin system
MKVVLDSNVLLVALGKRSKYRSIWNAFIKGKIQLIISDEIVFEYTEILQRFSAPGLAEIVMEIFIESPDIIFQQVYYNWNAIEADPDDNKFFDVAVAANADYLVTDDAHFNSVKNSAFPSVVIISAKEFLDIINL